MRNFLLGGIFVALIACAGFAAHPVSVHAQAATPYALLVAPNTASTVANCPAVISGQTQFCWVQTGEFNSSAGAAWACVPGTGPLCPASATPTNAVTSLIVNGVTKTPVSGVITLTLTDSSTVAASAPAITVGAPPIAFTPKIVVQ